MIGTSLNWANLGPNILGYSSGSVCMEVSEIVHLYPGLLDSDTQHVSRWDACCSIARSTPACHSFSKWTHTSEKGLCVCVREREHQLDTEHNVILKVWTCLWKRKGWFSLAINDCCFLSPPPKKTTKTHSPLSEPNNSYTIRANSPPPPRTSLWKAEHWMPITQLPLHFFPFFTLLTGPPIFTIPARW